MNLGTPRVTLLNGFTVDRGGAGMAVSAIDLPQGPQRLIAHVCLRANGAHDAVSRQLWPDLPAEQSRDRLRSALSYVQEAVPGLIDVSRRALALVAVFGWTSTISPLGRGRSSTRPSP